MKTSLLALALLAFSHCLPAQTTLFADNFNGSTATLIGLSPDTRPGSEVWGGSPSILANGSFTDDVGAYVPLTLAAGNIYQLSTTIQAGAGWAGWIGMGFITGNPAANVGRFANNSALDWFLLHVDGRLQYFSPNSNGQISTGSDPQNRALVYGITINASNGNPLNWTVTGSLTFGGNTYFFWPESGMTTVNAGITSLSQITGVGFGSQGGTGAITNFSLTATAVHEPSAYAVFASLAALGIVWMRQRRGRIEIQARAA